MKTLSRAEAGERAAALRVSSYDVHLDLTADGDHFGSTTVVRFSCLRDGADTFIEHDVPQVHAVELDGSRLAVQIDGNRLLLRALPAGDHVLVVRASGEYSRTGEGLHRFVDPADGRRYLYQHSFLDEAQRTFACFDQPDLKATITLSAEVPPDWLVVSTARGSLVGDRWSFEPTPPLSTYLFCVAAGPWHAVHTEHDGIRLGLWCRRSMSGHLDAEELFTVTRQSLDLQQQLFGRRYPFGDTYDQVFVPEFGGAMENPGVVVFGDDFLFRSKVTAAQRRLRAEVVAHEMAHMWFGDLVTMGWWEDLWLNESFAELLGVLTVAEATGFCGSWAAFAAGRKAWGYRADQLPTTHPVAGEAPDTRAALLNFDGISYAKGASVLRQLMAYVGRDAFFEGVRAYLRRYAWSNTSLADLLAELETSSGRELRAWSAGWLRTSGVSTLRPVWTGDRLAVRQESPTPRTARIGVGRYDLAEGRLRRRDLTEVEVSGELTHVPLDGPRPDLLLLNDGDLAFAKVRFDDRSAASLTRDLHTIPDDVSRAVCWGALWDATRDAELPATAFLDAVHSGVATEVEPEQLRVLLEQAGTAAARYTPPAGRGAALARLADGCWVAAQQAPPGGDQQLVQVRAFVLVADDERVDGLLTGAAPPGLAVDTDLRWHVLRRLAALGRAGPDRLDAELAGDRTAAGERQHAAAAAARPDPEAKRHAFDLLTGSELPADLVWAVGSAFWQRGQEALCRPWVQRYFAALPGLWSARTPAVAQAVTAVLYPRLDEPQVLARTDEFLARPDLPAGCRRLVLEQRDDVARALRAAGMPPL